MPRTRIVCPYCGVGCGLYIVTDEYGRPTRIEGAVDNPVNRGKLCPKAYSVLDVLRSPERLKKPLKRTEDGKFVEISWGEAIKTVAENLDRIRREYGPDAIGFLASAKCTNEDNYVLQKFARVLGTNNVDHCARLCHSPTVVGLSITTGAGALTATYEDIADSNFILIFGWDAAETHPIIFGQYVLRAKDRGAKVAVVDPRCTRTAWHADYYLPIRPGTDIPVAYAMIHTIISEGLYDKEFVKKFVKDFDKLAQVASKYPPEVAEKISGAPAGLIREVAREFAKAGKASLLWCMGVTQHTKGSNNVMVLAALAAICGYYGREGCCVGGIRGQVNVQGACDMGALSVFLPGYVRVTDEAGRKNIAKLWGLQDLPAQPGLTVVEMANAAAEGKLKAMYIMGENPMVSDPHITHVREGLEKLDFLVVQDIFLSETAELADIVLPAAATLCEREGSVTSSERRVQWTFKAVDPPGEAKPDFLIIREVAKEMGLGAYFPYTTVEDVTAEINKVIPAYAGITAERLKKTVEGIIWPCPSPDHPGTRVLHVGRFRTPDGMFNTQTPEYTEAAELPDAEYPLVLTTGRVVGQYHTRTMTKRSPPLEKRWPEPLAEIHPETAAKYNVRDGQLVKIVTRRGEYTCRVKLTEHIVKDTVFVPWHWGANVLTNPALDPLSKMAELKVCACKIIPLEG